MKKLIIFVMLATLFACNKDDDTDSSLRCNMSAKINGEDFCSVLEGAAYFLYNPSTKSLYLAGIGAGRDFQFRIENAAKGTFSLATGGSNFALFTTGILSTHYEAVSGTLTISHFASDLVEGTFEFIARGEDPLEGTNVTFNITNGKFKLRTF